MADDEEHAQYDQNDEAGNDPGDRGKAGALGGLRGEEARVGGWLLRGSISGWLQSAHKRRFYTRARIEYLSHASYRDKFLASLPWQQASKSSFEEESENLLFFSSSDRTKCWMIALTRLLDERQRDQKRPGFSGVHHDDGPGACKQRSRKPRSQS